MHDHAVQIFRKPFCRESCRRKEKRPLLLIRPPELDRREAAGRVEEAPIAAPAAALQLGYLDSCNIAPWATIVNDDRPRHHLAIGSPS